ncbi:MAG: hypothetical protein AB1758_27190, partial [Candidatus Eremiobacterota bacterium]
MNAEVVRAWWGRDGLWVRLARVPDLQVERLVRSPNGSIFLGLSAPPFDPEDGPIRMAARWVSSNQVELLGDTQELELLFRQDSIERLLRPDLLKAELDDLFSFPPAWGTAAWYEQCRRERGLSYPFRLLHQPVSGLVRLVSVERLPPNRLQVQLEQAGREEDFEALAVEGDAVALLPWKRTFVGEVQHVHLGRLTAQGLEPVEEPEFLELSRRLIDRLEERRQRDFHLLTPDQAEKLTERLRRLVRVRVPA